jgi:hypothetical protein
VHLCGCPHYAGDVTNMEIGVLTNPKPQTRAHAPGRGAQPRSSGGTASCFLPPAHPPAPARTAPAGTPGRSGRATCRTARTPTCLPRTGAVLDISLRNLTGCQLALGSHSLPAAGAKLPRRSAATLQFRDKLCPLPNDLEQITHQCSRRWGRGLRSAGSPPRRTASSTAG